MPHGSMAEGVGFEPTVPFDTTVFETVRFVRSRIPPANRLAGAKLLKELREQLGRNFFHHSALDHDFMVQAGVAANIVE